MGNLFVSNSDSSDDSTVRLVDHNPSSTTSHKKRKTPVKSLVVNSFQRITFSNLKEHDKLHPHVNFTQNVPATATMTDDSFSVITNPLTDFIVNGAVVAEGLSLFEDLKASNLLVLDSQRSYIRDMEMQTQLQVAGILESHEVDSRRLLDDSKDHISDIEHQNLIWEQNVKSLEASLKKLQDESTMKDFDIKDLQETLSDTTDAFNKVSAENRDHRYRLAQEVNAKANATLNVAASIRKLREKLSREKHIIIYSLVGVADYDHVNFLRGFENDPDFDLLLSQVDS